MALPQIRRLLHPDRRHRHVGRLVPPYSPNSSCRDFTDVEGEKAWNTDQIHDRRPVSLTFKRKYWLQKLNGRHT